MLPFPRLFNGWFGLVPPIEPTKIICFTPTALAAKNSSVSHIHNCLDEIFFLENCCYLHQFDSFDQSNQPKSWENLRLD